MFNFNNLDMKTTSKRRQNDIKTDSGILCCLI